MRIIEQSHEILYLPENPERMIEVAGRTCYKTEGQTTGDSAPGFVRMLRRRGLSAMLEFADMTVRFVTNRGVTHELVRHRLIKAAQESTRYVNYSSDDIQFILPVWWPEGVEFTGKTIDGQVFLDSQTPKHEHRLKPVSVWIRSMAQSEMNYHKLIELGWAPQQAREVLPNSLKTEIVIGADLREWRHIFSLRAVGTTGPPHPQMRALMAPVLFEAACCVPAMFEDLLNQYNEKYGPWED